MKTLADLLCGDREDLASLISRFLDPSCHTQRELAVLAREIVHSPAVGVLAREALARAERLCMQSPADAYDAWRELTEPLLSGFCCKVDEEVVGVLMGPPYRPGLDRPLAWFEEACDDCYGRFMQALKLQRLLCAESALAAWNEYQEGGLIARAVRQLENEEPLRFPDSEAGRDACSEAYELSKEALPKKLEDVKGLPLAAARSVHTLAAARLMNAHRYTCDIPAAKEMLLEVKRLRPTCASFHKAEINALIGTLNAELGNAEEALESLGSAVDAFSEQDQHLAGVWTVQLAEAERNAGRDSVLSTLSKAMMLLDPRRDPDIHQITAINMAFTLVQKEQVSEAREIIESIDFSNQRFLAAGAFIKATIDRSRGDLDGAYQQTCSSVQEYLSLKRTPDVAACLLLRGEIQQERGIIAEALHDFAAAVELFEVLDFAKFRMSAIRKLGRAVAAGNAAEAARLARRIREQPEPPPYSAKDMRVNQRERDCRQARTRDWFGPS